MRSTTTTSLSLLLLAPTALCDFTIYAAGVGGTGITDNLNGWQVYPKTAGVIKCDIALEWIWRQGPDVSGGQYGVRCKYSEKGKTCSRAGAGDKIEVLEFNTKPRAGDTTRTHFTYYADRGGAMIDLNGKNLGTCRPVPNEHFYCGGSIGRTEGTKMLDCTSALVANDFRKPNNS
ncbi:hypothetical protein DM02DRAFT_676188 [Periconia macrospinosa]|uniref:Uncharacterized protein n=1 Tax=Periconia macrospinosa TaxID=97972 RepID=A0A2V1D8R7_9PLEO|nr:hypothetical protein DM02DRAFT_676188 [Periconia macrospinosa]